MSRHRLSMAGAALVLGVVASPSIAQDGGPAFPAAPVVSDNGDGTVKIIGSGSTFWHIALQPAGGGHTTYLYPDISALQTVYAPPPSTPCVAVESQSGGTGRGDGDLGSWSDFTCVTGTPPVFPAAPKVTDNGNGTVTISGTGDSYWHLALQPAGGGTTTYPYPDVPSSQPVFTPPASTPCVAVQAQSGGTGGVDGTLGNWSGFTCATGLAHYPLATVRPSADRTTVKATSIGADAITFTQSTDAAGQGALTQTIPLLRGSARPASSPSPIIRSSTWCRCSMAGPERR